MQGFPSGSECSSECHQHLIEGGLNQVAAGEAADLEAVGEVKLGIAG